jgi:hypothetical protein
MICTHNCPSLATNSARRICVDVRSPFDPPLTVSSLQSYLRSKEKDPRKLRAVFLRSKLWAPGTITVGFLGGEEWRRAWTAKVVTDTIALYAGLTFSFDLGPNGASAMIRIAFDESEGCYSRLGTDALQNWGGLNNSMNLGWTDAPLNHTFSYGGRSYTTSTSFDQGGYPGQGTTIVHEFGHALGMVHEHQTPFGNPLVWDDAAVYSAFGGPPNNWSRLDIQSNILSVYSGVGMNGSNFDPLSIMKYSFPSGLLLRPSSEVAAEVERFNLTLSACDKYWIAANYPGKASEEDLLAFETECAAAPGLSSPNVYLVFIVLAALWLILRKR